MHWHICTNMLSMAVYWLPICAWKVVIFIRFLVIFWIFVLATGVSPDEIASSLGNINFKTTAIEYDVRHGFIICALLCLGLTLYLMMSARWASMGLWQLVAFVTRTQTTRQAFYLFYSRCSSTQTAPPCGGSICCSLRATSAASPCQRSTLPMGSVWAPSVLCAMAAWSLTRPCQELRRICWVTDLAFTHLVFLLWLYRWVGNSCIFGYSAQILSLPSSVTLLQYFCASAQRWLKFVGVISFCPDIFAQQCHFLRQCGHSEKAISMFQAMIDFTFFKPESVQQLPTKQQVNTLTVDRYADKLFLSTQCE